jgi:nucleoside-diphosphate-sugar epimerase
MHGISKLAATLYAQAQSVGRPIITLRLFSTYGPGDNPRRLVPSIIAGALQRTPVSLSRPEIARDWIYVDDVVDLYLEAARRTAHVTGNVFNVGSGLATRLAEIVDIVFRLTASNAEIRWGVFPAPKHDDSPWVADMHHTFEAFQWRPRISLEEGLRRSIDALRQDNANL